MKFPPPGQMVDIGGRRLHLQICERGARTPACRVETLLDTSSPTVILEAGLAATSLSWATVQPLIAEFARVASYDRAGLGWSDNAVAPATALNAAQDLNALLSHAELPGPYILVGHSLGGLIVRIFQQQYPEQVAGLVLVDPVARVEWREPTDQRRRMLARGVALSRRGALLARAGIVRFALNLLLSGSQKVPALLAKTFAGRASGVTSRLTGEIRKIPREHWPVIAANWSEERAFRTMANYLENLPLSASQLDEELSLSNLPVTILSATTASTEATAEHEHDAGLSTRGEHLIVPGTGHWVNLDAPEIIAQAVHKSLQN
jgi:pimeloyl-ACP methyl ester carboxylesterase